MSKVKVCQMVAVVSGQKTEAANSLTEAHNRKLKPDLLNGLDRSYKPMNDDASVGEFLPPENKRVQTTVPTVIGDLSLKLAEMFDAVYTLDIGNTIAKGDIAVDGVTLLSNCPVTYMIFLEKQLTDLGTFASKLPTLDTTEEWIEDPDIEGGGYRTPEFKTIKTAKVLLTHIAYEATEKHPAQTQTDSFDRPVGIWSNVKRSGALRPKDRHDMVARIHRLKTAVVMARELANRLVKRCSSGRNLSAKTKDMGSNPISDFPILSESPNGKAFVIKMTLRLNG